MIAERQNDSIWFNMTWTRLFREDFDSTCGNIIGQMSSSTERTSFLE